MNFVVISAALSSMNTNIYLCSRMLFSLSRGGYAPQFLGASSDRGSPVAAILVSGACILVAAAVSIFTPNAYDYLLGVALFAAILVWMFILLSHLSFRRRHAAEHCRCACRSSRGCSTPALPAGRDPGHHGARSRLRRVVDVRRALADPDLGRLFRAGARRAAAGAAPPADGGRAHD